MKKGENKEFFRAIRIYLETRYGQSYFLIRHFFNMLINNSLIKSESHESEKLAVATVFFSLSGGVISHIILKKYLIGLSTIDWNFVWFDIIIFMTLTMTLMGIICAVVWNNLFLDKGDYANLLVLPVKILKIFKAKFLSTLIFVLSISFFFNFSSSLVFAGYLSQKLQIHPLYFVFVHLIANLLANLFVFFFISVLHGIMTVLFNNRLMKNLSVYMQVAIISGFIWILFWLPNNLDWMNELKESKSPLLNYLPPFWFLGLEEKLLNSPDKMVSSLAPLAVLALAITLLIYFLMFPISLLKYIRSSHSNNNYLRIKFLKFFSPLRRLFIKIFLRNPIQAGTFYFVWHIFRRNLKVKLQLGFFLVAPIAVITSILVNYITKQGLHYFERISAFLISIPLILAYFSVAALRGIINYPINKNANWVIRLTESSHKGQYMAGLKKAVFFFGVFPLFFILFIFYTYFWGFKAAFFHILFATAIVILLIEVCFLNYKKMPFVSTSIPNKTGFKYLVLFYSFSFIIYSLHLTELGIYLLKNPERYLFFYPVVLLVYSILKWYQKKYNSDYQFIFEEEQEPYFLSLGLEKFSRKPQLIELEKVEKA